MTHGGTELTGRFHLSARERETVTTVPVQRRLLTRPVAASSSR